MCVRGGRRPAIEPLAVCPRAQELSSRPATKPAWRPLPPCSGASACASPAPDGLAPAGAVQPVLDVSAAEGGRLGAGRCLGSRGWEPAASQVGEEPGGRGSRETPGSRSAPPPLNLPRELVPARQEGDAGCGAPLLDPRPGLEMAPDNSSLLPPFPSNFSAAGAAAAAPNGSGECGPGTRGDEGQGRAEHPGGRRLLLPAGDGGARAGPGAGVGRAEICHLPPARGDGSCRPAIPARRRARGRGHQVGQSLGDQHRRADSSPRGPAGGRSRSRPGCRAQGETQRQVPGGRARAHPAGTAGRACRLGAARDKLEAASRLGFGFSLGDEPC